MRARLLAATALFLTLGACYQGTRPSAMSAQLRPPSPPVIEPVAAPKSLDLTIKGPTVTLCLHTLPLANLAYQLDCMADLIPCSIETYQKLWKESLSWSSQDDTTLEQWKRLRTAYTGEIKLKSNEQTSLSFALPVNYDALAMDERIRISSFLARDEADYQRVLGPLVAQQDRYQLSAILHQFQPRFDPWWDQQAFGDTSNFVNGTATLIQSKKLDVLIGKIAHFYESELPENAVVDFHVMARPNLGGKDTHGQQLEAHSIIETVSGEQPRERIDVIIHELSHYFYEKMAPASRAELQRQMVRAPQSLSIAWYGLLNEAVATAIGNGMVGRMVTPPQEFERTLARENGLYSDHEINATALALLPSMEPMLEKGTVISSRAFVTQYLAAAQGSVGSEQSPAVYLREMSSAFNEPFLSVWKTLRKGLQVSSSYRFTPIDQEARDFLKKYPYLSSLVLLTPEELEHTPWAGIFSDKDVAEMKKLARKKEPFVYAAARTPKSFAFVFVSSDPEKAKALVRDFLKRRTVEPGALK